MCQIEKYILQKIKKSPIHMTLIDPEKTYPKQALEIAKAAEGAGTSAIMIGGSTLTTPYNLDKIIKAIKKKVKIPIILFPGNISGVCKYADAIWFMSLLNSTNRYFITGAQILAAPLVKKYSLEPIPLGYIIVGEGGTAAIIGQARPIPYNKPEISALYALAAQYLGMHFVYLEAGSGATKPVPSNMIKLVRSYIDIPIIVGGGIRTGIDIQNAVKAGANIVVTGTIVEKEALIKEKIADLVNNLHDK
ncbi:geranylgeranylglyceryl/heptaprenylglyceryl phosphate synthase [Candidatus Bathyarchaeota archaeon]|nr:geranylgeranylglyceryl/heptaprenylglyceryl phosphate synthase [Candidatus Bathyarchaeota archaeon]